VGTLEVIKHQVEAGASSSLRQREAQLDARDRQLTAQAAAARDAEAANDAKVCTSLADFDARTSDGHGIIYIPYQMIFLPHRYVKSTRVATLLEVLILHFFNCTHIFLTPNTFVKPSCLLA
jgi:hypothetical protein